MARIFYPLLCVLLVALGCPIAAQTLNAGPNQSAPNGTSLIGLSFHGLNSAAVRQAARDGFELSGGAVADMGHWYSPRFPNVSATFLTTVSPHLSLLWGGSLGERGPKYSLGPAGMFGVMIRRPMGRRSWLNLEAVGHFGGALRESSCLGDYGAIGGVQAVNCRLAASVLPPAQTLDYLWNTPPIWHGQVKISFEIRF